METRLLGFSHIAEASQVASRMRFGATLLTAQSDCSGVRQQALCSRLLRSADCSSDGCLNGVWTHSRTVGPPLGGISSSRIFVFVGRTWLLPGQHV